MPVIKKKMSGKDWNPKTILATPAEINTLQLGVVFGIIKGISSGTMPDGETFEGLSGIFKFIPDDKKLHMEVNSYILYPPSGMCGDLFDIAHTKIETAFAFRVSVHKSGNPAGYEWAIEPLIEATETDPLALLADELAEKGALALSVDQIKASPSSELEKVEDSAVQSSTKKKTKAYKPLDNDTFLS